MTPKLIVHDYAGHPFQVELSRELARRGWTVIHAFFADDAGPKGELDRRPGDPAGLSFVGIRLQCHYDKDALVSRRFADLVYGREVASLVRQQRPDIVLSGNTPTEAQGLVADACRETGARFVAWIQDFYSIAATRLLGRRLGLAGRLVGRFYQMVERRQLAQADAVVIITEQFRDLAERWCGDAGKVFTIENWGHLNGIAPLPKANAWSERHGLADGFNFLYSGTLGLKHDPQLLIALADRMAGRARVVVVGQGSGMAQLEHAKAVRPIDNLVLLPVQPFANFSQVLAAADVALAVIEPDAGIFSVPSKVQSYLCAARAVLMSSTRDNLAARVVLREGAGLVTAPQDGEGFLRAADRLLAEPGLRDVLASRGRAYAERAYEIERVADRFEHVFARAMAGVARTPATRHHPQTTA